MPKMGTQRSRGEQRGNGNQGGEFKVVRARGGEQKPKGETLSLGRVGSRLKLEGSRECAGSGGVARGYSEGSGRSERWRGRAEARGSQVPGGVSSLGEAAPREWRGSGPGGA